ncbi:response regulator [Acidisoma silvae]|uniref:Sensory/regulatory protein RpfC n=1 Tax=Acidisoma silvae TaxID=2802396 RepID=A0A963YRT2_9PROT|nr:response regulator [Acidisoma silvae]MCB8875839.1 response regulator [Acidisoma silvae]
MVEILALRSRFGQLMALLLWGHVPLIVIVSWGLGQSVLVPTLFAVILAATYHVSWKINGIGPATRYISAVALVGEPALLVYLLRGNPWQIDMHMYFFACLALLIAWCDWRAILLASVAIGLHHLALDLLLPAAVFPNGGDIARVVFHAAVVLLEGSVLMWISNRLVESFTRVEQMSAEIQRHNETLEETVAERTKDAQAASVAKSLFLANMSHEIRTPMNAILGFSHLALRTEMTPKQRDYLVKIKSATTSLLDLINDILDFSKIEAGKLVLERTSFQLRHSLDSVRQMLALRAVEKNVALEFNISADTPDTVVGDPLRLNQIVTNLVSNAIKFTDAGHVQFSARVIRKQGDDLLMEFSVRDSGIGMTPSQVDQLFKAFTQADTSMTRRFGGTGLGLSISRQLVELMGGTLTVQSEQGIGSQFSFTAQLAVSSQSSVPSPASIAYLRHLRVLIADDNAGSRQILSETLSPWFGQLDLAASGHEALALLRTANRTGKPFDLVLVDWRMPGLDGIETINQMRDDPSIPKMPTIMMVTAYSREEAISAAGAAGIAAFLVKPLDTDVLMETLSALFGTEEVQPALAPEQTVMIAAPYRGAVLLLVEDNEINRELAFEILTDAGLVVETAENGRIACEMIEAEPSRYDAVLMDVQMPEMDGIEATKRIRQSLSATDLPIIAMTAHAYEQERQNCLDAGMNDHSSKPIEPPLLLEKLSRWLKPDRDRTVRPAPAPVETVAPAPAVPAADENLPATLPPFDLPTALARLNGRRKLLRKLIIDFGYKFADAVPTLHHQIDDQEWDEARRSAHTLKGTAGALEIREVAESARQVEDALARRVLDDLPRLMQRLDETMKPALTAAQSLRGQSPVAPLAPALLRAGTLDYSAVTSELAELHQLLQRRSLKARKMFEALEAKLGNTPEGLRLDPIRQALASLDYPKALSYLEELTTPANVAEDILP